MNQFDSYLSHPDGHNLVQFGMLTSPIIRDRIMKKVSVLISGNESLLMSHIY